MVVYLSFFKVYVYLCHWYIPFFVIQLLIAYPQIQDHPIPITQDSSYPRSRSISYGRRARLPTEQLSIN